jgi:2-hydroxy-3-keto-5-methylthiopentenyl-1-phosphate phosphatase
MCLRTETQLIPSGMMPTIRAVLSNLLPAEDANSIDIIANDVKYTDAEGKGTEWEIVYRHPESGFGHDKSKAILPYRDLENVPTLFFCGDGVSGEWDEANVDQVQEERSYAASSS